MEKKELEDFLYEHFFWCGCFESDSAIDEILKILKWASADFASKCDYDELFNSKGVYYLIIGICDKAGLVDHGISCRCAFITDKGKDVLTSINKYHDDLFDDEFYENV